MNGTGKRQVISAESVPAMGPDGKLRSVRARRLIAQSTSHQVYFLYACGRIKIGTSKDPLRRALIDILPYCPVPLVMLGTIIGGPVIEGQLHKRFEAERIRDEWFRLSPELRAFLCDDETRKLRLEDAEDDYEEWLEEELYEQQQIYAGAGDRPDGEASRPVPGHEDGD